MGRREIISTADIDDFFEKFTKDALSGDSLSAVHSNSLFDKSRVSERGDETLAAISENHPVQDDLTAIVSLPPQLLMGPQTIAATIATATDTSSAIQAIVDRYPQSLQVCPNPSATASIPNDVDAPPSVSTTTDAYPSNAASAYPFSATVAYHSNLAVSSRNSNLEAKTDELSAYHRCKSSHYVSSGIQDSIGLSPVMVQQESVNLQQQTSAPGATPSVSVSTKLTSSTMNSDISSGLSMYTDNSVTYLPTLTTENYLSNFMENSTGSVLGIKLNGHNHFLWSQCIKLVLEGCRKFEYLTGKISKPRPGDPQEHIWKGEDSLLRSFLINSMEPQIGNPLLYATTARDIWDATKTLYCKKKNGYHLYTLHKQAHECKQGTMDVVSYFNKLFIIWQELDLSREIIWDCPCGGVEYFKIKEVDRVFNFLAGLNSKFDLVRDRILEQWPIPSLFDVLSKVRSEEERINAMNITVVLNGPNSEKQNGKQTPVCEHCKKSWHTKDQCWKLHGRPLNGKRRPQ